MKDNKHLLSKAEVEEVVRKRMAELKPVLLKQKVFTNVVSLWNFSGQYVEITQNTNGKYIVYLMSEEEARKWDKGDGSHCEDMGGQRMGNPVEVLISESVKIERKEE